MARSQLPSLSEFGRRQISRLPTSVKDFLRRHLPRFRQGEVLIRAIDRAMRGIGQVSVVQIGSNDGISNDPLNRLITKYPDWTALFVEPFPALFSRLKETYGPDPRFSFANVAISASAGHISFTYVDERIATDLPGIGSWFDRIGSLDRTHVKKYLPALANTVGADVATIEGYVRTTEVEAVTLADLFDRFELRKLDLFHLDTEGHDWIVLSQLDLSRWRPKVILFEHVNLTEADVELAHKFLDSYDFRPFGMDTLCIRR